MILDSIFVTPMFHDFLNLETSILEECAYRLQGQSEGRKKSNRLGWQSNDIQYDEDLDLLVSEINNKLTEIQKYCNIVDPNKLVMDNLWFNINSKYSYNRSHIHAKSFFSGVYYVKVPENSGNLNFRNPSNLQRLFVNEINDCLNEINNFTAQNWVIQPKNNMLVLFPSWLEHDVDQNLSDDDRISIAFNTRILFS